MKMTLYNYSFLLVFCVSCTTNNITNITEHDRLGITIYTGDRETDSTIVLSFLLDRLVDTLPIITVNNNYPDAPHFDPLSFSFHNIKFNDSFAYQISYKNDTIRDSAFIPGIIDSLFVNNVYISPEAGNDIIWLPDSSDSLHFYWKDSNISNYYYIYIHSNLINQQIDKYTSDSALTLFIDAEKNDYEGNTAIHIAKWDDFDLYRWPFSAISSKELFVYYKIDGPSYSSYKRLLR
jgi:hypothetical protein